MKRVGLFGGSFNPIHKGHIEIIKAVRKEMALDEVWFLPTVQTPLKGQIMTSFKHRCNMIKLAIKPYRYMKLNTAEEKMATPSYTYNLVKYLKSQYIHEFFWIIGDDQYLQLDKWYKIDELKKLVSFIVVKRSNTALKVVEDNFYYIEVNPFVESSTAVREGNFSYLYPAVRNYINKHALYYEEVIKHYMGEKRYEHSVATKRMAVSLAKHYHYPEGLVALAAYLHDIAKELPSETAKTLMTNYYPQLLNTNIKIWHQYLGIIIAKRDFGVTDRRVLKAIFHHTTGTSDSRLSKIVYCADKIDDTRKYDTSYLIASVRANLNEGFKLVQKRVIEHIKTKENLK